MNNDIYILSLLVYDNYNKWITDDSIDKSGYIYKVIKIMHPTVSEKLIHCFVMSYFIYSYLLFLDVNFKFMLNVNY
jgi:hypothetical protein